MLYIIRLLMLYSIFFPISISDYIKQSANH
nr:MAG TPA: hypothetical protein [Caudoviricetes sp.]